MWGPQDSVQLVQITPISLWFYGTQIAIYSIPGANLNQQASLGGLTLPSGNLA